MKNILHQISYMLNNIKIKKYHFSYFYKLIEYETNSLDKILIALNKDIDINDVLQNEQILLFVPQAFDSKGRPLFDPNQFSIHGYFYNNCDKKEAKYPLYEFNLISQANDALMQDNTKNTYINKLIDIKDLSLEEYLIYSYICFYDRVYDRVKML